MPLADNKIDQFQKRVSDLADKPNIGSAAALKAYFDSSPEELRVAVNGLIDILLSVGTDSGAHNVGSGAISGVNGATVYEQLASIKAQIDGIILGSVPDKSITDEKLSDSVLIGRLYGVRW